MGYLDDKTTWFTCQCCTHALGVTTFDDEDSDIALSLWSYRYVKNDDWWTRIRCAWRALQGKLYRDEIVLDHEAAHRLGEHLVAISRP